MSCFGKLSGHTAAPFQQISARVEAWVFAPLGQEFANSGSVCFGTNDLSTQPFGRPPCLSTGPAIPATAKAQDVPDLPSRIRKANWTADLWAPSTLRREWPSSKVMRQASQILVAVAAENRSARTETVTSASACRPATKPEGAPLPRSRQRLGHAQCPCGILTARFLSVRR